MSSIKTTVLATLILALVGCESDPLTVRSIFDASTAELVTPDARISRPDTAPVITFDAYVAPVLVVLDAQIVPDLSPIKTDTVVADAFVAKPDTTADVMVVEYDAGTAETLFAKPDLATPDSLTVKIDTLIVQHDAGTPDMQGQDTTPIIVRTPDAYVPDTTPVKTDALSALDALGIPDTQPSPDLVPVKTDTQAAGIVVAYSAANPPGYTMYNGTEKVGLLRVNLSGTGNVQSITFKHHGSAPSDWGNFYLFDGDKLLMSASVDPVTNEIVFSRLVLALASTTSQLFLTGDLNTSAAAGDTHYFSLESAEKVVANVTVGGTFPVVGNTFTASGVLPLTFEPSADSPVPSMIVTANTTDNSVLRMDIDGASEPVSVQYATFFATGNNTGADIVSLRIYDNAGTLFCSGALNSNGALMCANDAGLFTINGKTTITIKANIDQVYPPGTPYRAASGDQFKAGIKIQMNVSVPAREGSFKAFGVNSGMPYTQRDLATGAATSWSLMGPTMTLRKTELIIATIAIPGTLANGEQTVYKFSATAANNNDAGLRQFTLEQGGWEINLSGYRLKENGSLLDPSLYTMTTVVGNIDQTKPAADTVPYYYNQPIVVRFANEKTIAAGTTKVYEVVATVGNTIAGSMVQHQLLGDSYAAQGTADGVSGSNFVWSDDSSEAHSTASNDWLNGYLVKTLPTATATLSL